MAGCLLEFVVEVFFRAGFEYLVFGGTSKSARDQHPKGVQGIPRSPSGCAVC